MLDLIGTFFVTGYLGSIVMVGFSRARETGTTATVVIFLLCWFAAQAVVLFAVDGIGPKLPPNLFTFGLSLVLLSAAWTLFPALRRAVATTQLEIQVTLHIWRLGGFLFLLLYAAHRLPSPFAPVAAVGDMITGAVAAGLVIALARGFRPASRIIWAWNMFGLLDLIAAVGLALLATPGTPFQVFTDTPVRSAFTQLPWILVPAAIVPVLFFVHLAIFLNLRMERDRAPAGSTERSHA